MPKQPADNSSLNTLAVHFKAKWRHQIDNNVVVVPGIKSDILATALRDRANHIDRLVAIERSNFNGDDIFSFSEAPPEREAQQSATRCGLKIKSDQWNDFSDTAAMSDHFVFHGIAERAEAEKRRVIAKFIE